MRSEIGKQKEKNEKPHPNKYKNFRRFNIFSLMFIELNSNLKVKNSAKKSFGYKISSWMN